MTLSSQSPYTWADSHQQMLVMASGPAALSEPHIDYQHNNFYVYFICILLQNNVFSVMTKCYLAIWAVVSLTSRPEAEAIGSDNLPPNINFDDF